MEKKKIFFLSFFLKEVFGKISDSARRRATLSTRLFSECIILFFCVDDDSLFIKMIFRYSLNVSFEIFFVTFPLNVRMKEEEEEEVA